LEHQIAQVQSTHPSCRDFTTELRLREEFEKVHTQLEVFWHQRSRINWVSYGDRNTKFFHNAATIHWRKNMIMSLQRDDGTWTDTDQQTRRELVDYFKGLYTQNTEPQNLEIMNGLLLPTVPQSAHQRLTLIPSEIEILKNLKEMGLDKAPGPDGFTVRFLIREWQVIGLAVVQ
jgi:hypothetical protein